MERLQEKGKKVVVSMGSVAASGGYYVAMGADAIVANRSTITGSIGVFGGKFAIADGLRGVRRQSGHDARGREFASAYSTEKLTNLQRPSCMTRWTATYQRFTSLVAEGAQAADRARAGDRKGPRVVGRRRQEPWPSWTRMAA